MAVAAVLALFVYMNFKRQGNDLPSDEAVLVFSTIGARPRSFAAAFLQVALALPAQLHPLNLSLTSLLHRCRAAGFSLFI